ncbi:glycosyltransferase [Pseudoalteromonas sp. SA25]|uniref:glycosyltransferase n=1 Tax=Pseudoalteromonas sp. SA25 TaxID=2686347 RepID=UPI0013FD7CA7|nr:glycosyltransferase [Pseudoalteromonas sp. SA25]
MTVYNEEIEHLQLALESTVDALANIESSNVFVYVDNKNENLDSELLSYLSFIDKFESKVNVYFSDMNIGLAKSLNYVINNFCKDFKLIARMDADDVCDIRRFDIQLNEIENTNVDILGSNAVKIDESNHVIGHIINKESPRFLYGNEMVHPSLIFKKEVFDELSGYRNYLAAQDYDFLCRAKSLNFVIVNLKEELINYRIRNGAIGQRRKKVQVMYKVGISKSFRNRTILTEELALNSSDYRIYDFIESRLKFNRLIYRFATVFSILHLKNYFLNFSKRYS